MFPEIEKSTVRVTHGGHGVIVGGDMILTAAHCIEYDTEGASAALGEHFFETIKATGYREFTASPLAVEPVSDVAALGQPDIWSDPEKADEYLWFVREFVPVPIFTGDLKKHEPFTIWIRSLKGTWVEGEARWSGEGPTLRLKVTEPIERGASGGPIVNDNGELVGLVSVFDESLHSGAAAGLAPCPQLALPMWILDKSNAQNRS